MTNVIGMIVMAVINAVLLTFSELHIIPMGWTWLILLGTGGTFLIGYIWGPKLDPGPPHVKPI